MYTQYFSLKQAPFSIAPDPRYLFMSERHREALAHLLYGVGSGGGFVLLTGEIGAGKTTVCRCFIEQVPADCALGYIFNPKLNALELLQSVCDEFHLEAKHSDSIKHYVDTINAYLLASHAQGKHNVLVIDEAQNLSAEVLEQLRLLTNLETNERKLLQVILIGQPELRTMLARPELEQLAQRVIARYHLGPLSAPETASYIAHRMTVAGATSTPFPRRLLARVHGLTRGVPRRINLLCDRALLGAYVENEREVTPRILAGAAAEVFSEAASPAVPRKALLAAGLFAASVALSVGAWHLVPRTPNGLMPAPASVQAKQGASPAASVPVKGASASQSAPEVNANAAPLLFASQDAALAELGGLWGHTLDEKSPCKTAPRDGLRCYQGKGALYALRQLDRPAVLALHHDGAVGYGLLVGIDAHSATLREQGKLQTISVAELAERFDGEFTTLWRAPQHFRDELRLGDKGADVDWLAAQLAALSKAAAPVEGEALGKATQAQLRSFQQQQQMKADGVAGPRTFMRLSQLGGMDEPRLLLATKAGK
jgi:general secretion pathway protein A